MVLVGNQSLIEAGDSLQPMEWFWVDITQFFCLKIMSLAGTTSIAKCRII